MVITFAIFYLLVTSSFVFVASIVVFFLFHQLKCVRINVVTCYLKHNVKTAFGYFGLHISS